MLGAIRIQTFNRACSGIVLAWFLLVGAVVMAVRPSAMDFPQFYMGGVVAQAGAWGDLYPTPNPDSWRNPGEHNTSIATPTYEQLLTERQIPERFRFIQLPPNAVAFWPLAYLSWQRALILWTAVMGVFAWLTLRQSANLFQLLIGGETKLAGVMMLAAGFSPIIIRSVRAGQVSCFVGFAIAATVTAMIRRTDFRGGLAAATGFITKYATVFLLPLVIVLQRWRLIAFTLAAGLLIVAVTLPVTGVAPYKAWLHDVAPYLNRSHDWLGNQSLQGFLLRTTGQKPIGRGWEAAVAVGRWTVFVAIVTAMWRRRAWIRGSAEEVIVAATALLAWMAVFSPIFWYHYAPYLLISYGWLCSLIVRGGAGRWMAIMILALVFWPICAQPSFAVREPFNSLMLWANLLLLSMAMIALCKPRRVPAQS